MNDFNTSRVSVDSGYLLDNEAAEAGRRFGALAGLFDAGTFRHVAGLGISQGWRCWEVGAGGPSVAAWMAEQAGPTGSLVATDIDVSWIVDRGAPAFEVRQHDVANDEPPAQDLDLVHARLVLIHVPGRDEALRRMVSALRPGGWLLIEDFDPLLGPFACPDPTELEHHRANRIRTEFYELGVERGVDLAFGRTLPRRLRQLGLDSVGANAYTAMSLPAGRDLEWANVSQVRAALVQRGRVTEEEVDNHLRVVAAGDIDVSFPPLVSAWGQKP